jgi:hypothetical protein
MKMLNHPNIVNLVEVINDPNIDKFYMGMQIRSYHYILILLLICILYSCHLHFSMWIASS